MRQHLNLNFLSRGVMFFFIYLFVCLLLHFMDKPTVSSNEYLVCLSFKTMEMFSLQKSASN